MLERYEDALDVLEQVSDLSSILISLNTLLDCNTTNNNIGSQPNNSESLQATDLAPIDCEWTIITIA